MVEQVIKYSDGTETVIKYNELGKSMTDEIEEVAPVEEEVAPEVEEEGATPEVEKPEEVV